MEQNGRASQDPAKGGDEFHRIAGNPFRQAVQNPPRFDVSRSKARMRPLIGPCGPGVAKPDRSAHVTATRTPRQPRAESAVRLEM